MQLTIMQTFYVFNFHLDRRRLSFTSSDHLRKQMTFIHTFLCANRTRSSCLMMYSLNWLAKPYKYVLKERNIATFYDESVSFNKLSLYADSKVRYLFFNQSYPTIVDHLTVFIHTHKLFSHVL